MIAGNETRSGVRDDEATVSVHDDSMLALATPHAEADREKASKKEKKKNK